MTSLFIDTATSISIVAILIDGVVVEKKEVLSNNNLSKYIFSDLEKLLKENNIDKIYVVVGPGSFTGIRIGVTIAKTYAWAKQIPVIPVSSLEVMASVSDKDIIIPFIDARRGYVFAGVYDKELNIIEKDVYINEEELKSKYKGDYINTNYGANIERVVKKHENDEGVNPHHLNPIYLKRTEAEENARV